MLICVYPFDKTGEMIFAEMAKRGYIQGVVAGQVIIVLNNWSRTPIVWITTIGETEASGAGLDLVNGLKNFSY